MLYWLLADFCDRNKFAEFLNKRGLIGTAVEVGVHRAEWARIFTAYWQGEQYWGVDVWACPPGYELQEKQLGRKGKTRVDDFVHASKVLSPHGGKCKLLVSSSEDAATGFYNNSLDFVYIDGDHREQAVYDDLMAWWPKVKPGGILAGHDIVTPGEINGGWSKHVQRAVTRFATSRGIQDVWIVIEPTSIPWSYYFEKGG